VHQHQQAPLFLGKNFHFSSLQQDMRASKAYNNKNSAARPTCMMESFDFLPSLTFKVFFFSRKETPKKEALREESSLPLVHAGRRLR
jgi:hypothetical protein